MRIHSPRTCRLRRGSVMVPAVLVVLAAATLSIVHLRLDLSRAREQRASIDSKRAFYMAEAGLAEGFAGIVGGMSGNVGTEDAPAAFANGLFWVVAKEEGRGRVSLESTGMCGAGRATLSLVLERRSSSTAANGFFADRDVVVRGGASVFSYDSALGSYERQDCITPRGARLGANGDVSVGDEDTRTAIHGDARPGPSGILQRAGEVDITGAMAPATSPVALPPIDVPSFGSLGGLVAGTTAGTIHTAVGEASYSTIEVRRGGDLVVSGPARLVVGQLRVAPGGRLTFDTSGGPVQLYVTDWLDLAGASVVGTSDSDPRSVSLLVSASGLRDRDGDGDLDPPVKLAADGVLQATIYAPDAPVSIPRTLTVAGAVCADSLTLEPEARVYFDRSLVHAGESDDALPQIYAWRVVELPYVPLVRLGYDAMRELRNEGIEPEQARDAHYAIGVTPR